MDRKQPESNPVQEALRPAHLSMRRELNCNRGSPKIPKRAPPKFMIPSKIGLSCSVFASRFQQYAPQDSRRSLDIRSSVASRAIPRLPQRSVKCIPCPSPPARAPERCVARVGSTFCRGIPAKCASRNIALVFGICRQGIRSVFAPKRFEIKRIVKYCKPPPFIRNAGYRVLYLQAHVPHSEYIGTASE